jgi:hypothetical protein
VILLCGTELPKYTCLGVKVCAGRKFRISTFHRRMKFFRAFNAIYAKTCGSGSELVTLRLTLSFCIPILFYGLEGVNLRKSLAASLEFCWARAMYKIFNVSDSAYAEPILFYVGILPISYQTDLCKLRFYHYNMYCNHVCDDDIVW